MRYTTSRHPDWSGKLKPEPRPARGIMVWEMPAGNAVAYPVKLYRTGHTTYAVVYGLQLKEDLDYAGAAKELGECILHHLACLGKLGA